MTGWRMRIGADGFERWRCETDMISCELMPELGGKVTSLLDGRSGHEFLFQNPKGGYTRPTTDTPFADCDASGFDDAFPNINPSLSIIEGHEIQFTDHGELWRTPMRAEVNGNALTLRCSGGALPYEYEKTLRLTDSALRIDYRINNAGDFAIPILWTLHCLVNCDESTRLVLPSEPEYAENVLDGGALGAKGALIRADERLCTMPPYGNDSMEKFYLHGRVNKGECGYEYPDLGRRLMLRYDADKLPYLGFWCTMGGFRGDVNCALEPSTGCYDSIETARERNALPWIEPGGVYEFSLQIEIEGITRSIL